MNKTPLGIVRYESPGKAKCMQYNSKIKKTNDKFMYKNSVNIH